MVAKDGDAVLSGRGCSCPNCFVYHLLVRQL